MLEPGFYNMDCMEAMKDFPDKYFDLAIVDPPYGNGYDGNNADGTGISGGALISTDGNAAGSEGGSKRTISRTGNGWAKKYNPGGIFSGATIKHWDVAPGDDYFRELARVSKNQIIFGGNYFGLPPTRCFIVWDKVCISENFTMSMCEYAWTSFNDNAKIYRITPQGTNGNKRFHPTQKPVELYSRILARYAKPGEKILDTHAGSASSLIAAHRQGMTFWGFEIDAEYYAKAKERLDAETAQINFFEAAGEQMEQIEIAEL